ncbi:MAG: TrkH family potassium uptake protein [Sedimentibacter sp.]|uniref:TrkH family potassium uptake protein n=1 Tax=Sedimentibacter sp. TaxID=1960295 RepID=UPI0031584580
MIKSDETLYAFKYIGIMLIFVAGIILLPVVVVPFYPEEAEYVFCFLIPAAVAGAAGVFMSRIIVPEQYRLTAGNAATIVVGTWCLAAFFSALPFMLAGTLNFTQAYFEAMSGWTTTGLSVIDVSESPRVFLLFRSIIQFFGGVGIVLIVVSALSESFGMTLFASEGHNDKLLPNIAKSARLIMKIYSGYFAAGTLLYVAFGMPAFDAVNHSMAALSTGGFSTRTMSIGAYDSLSIELVTVILMILGATNFYANMILVRGRFLEFFRLGETKLVLIMTAALVPVVAYLSLYGLYGSVSSALRISFFNLISALTTTGFSTVSYNDWPDFAYLVMIVLMVVGGGIGSTAGGIKLGRINILLRQNSWSLKRKFMPERMVNKPAVYRPDGKTFINPELYLESANYALTFTAFLLIGTCILTLSGYGLKESLFEFASAIGTVGLSVGVTGIHTPPTALWAMTFGMLLGRLEIFVVFYSIMNVVRKFCRREIKALN